MKVTANTSKVAVVHLAPAIYPEIPPFHPATLAPEYPHGVSDVSSTPNAVYDGVRSLWSALGMDTDRHGTPNWNPLKCLIQPGDRVLIKPNLICESNWKRPGQWQEVVTHPSVVRAIIDYVLIALGGSGRVTVADGPQTDSDFEALSSTSGLDRLIRFYRARGFPVELLDLRRDRWIGRGGVVRKREKLPGDPAGYVNVDLRERSAFSDYSLNGEFYGADYDVDETRQFHAEGRNEYVLSRSAMEADVIINVPKLKTHKKTGVTLSLKNLVGVNGYRNCLPHHTLGSPPDGGDEFPDAGWKRTLETLSIRGFKKVLSSIGGTAGPWAVGVKQFGRAVFGDTDRVIRSGNWEGNDTAWRMVLDLNQIVMWYDSDGIRRDRPRRVLSVVDAVLGGEGDGPLSPDPVTTGCLVGGTNPWAVDRTAVTEVMQLNPEHIPLLQKPLENPDAFNWLLPADPIAIIRAGASAAPGRPFAPHFGWPSLIRPPMGSEEMRRH